VRVTFVTICYNMLKVTIYVHDIRSTKKIVLVCLKLKSLTLLSAEVSLGKLKMTWQNYCNEA